MTVPKGRDIEAAKKGSKLLYYMYKMSHTQVHFREVDCLVKGTQRGIDSGVDQPEGLQNPRSSAICAGSFQTQRKYSGMSY